MMSVRALRAPRRRGAFDLYGALLEALEADGARLESGDVVVVSTKYAAVSQGRIARLDATGVSRRAARIASEYRIRPQVAEIVLRESDDILGGMTGFVLAYAAGVMAPNAGVDASNAAPGTVIMYPASPGLAAEQMRRRIFLGTGVRAGVVLADSRLSPGRVGTTGMAVACAGIEPVRDMRGEPDLEGRPLRVTFQAVADGIASAGNYAMSEGAQSRPFALVRGSGSVPVHRAVSASETTVGPSECVYVRGLSGGAPPARRPGD